MSLIRLVLCSFYAVFVTLLSAATLFGVTHLVELSRNYVDKSIVQIPPTNFNLTHVLLFSIIMVLLATGSKLNSLVAPAPVTHAKKNH